MLRRALAMTVTGLAVAACAPTQTGPVSSGTMALSADSAYLYVLEADQNKVYVFDANTYAPVTSVDVGKNPARIAVASDETIYVSNRGERSVSVITRKGASWTEATRIPVGVEPVGLAVTRDAKTLLVVNSAQLTDVNNGSLMAIDTASRQVKWETPVGHEPRAVGIMGSKAVVPLYFDKTATYVDLKSGNVVGTPDPLYNNTTIDNDPTYSSNGLYTASSGYYPTGLSDVATTPDGNRVFITGQWARIAPIERPPATGGYYSLGGPCSYGAVVSPALITVDNGKPAQATIDDLSSCAGIENVNPNHPPSAIPPSLTCTSPTCVPSSPGLEVAGPVAVVVSPAGDLVYVAAQQTGNVLMMKTYSASPQRSQLGAGVVAYADLNDSSGLTPGPSGLALPKDGRRLFVHNAFAHNFAVLTCDKCVESGTMTIAQTVTVPNPNPVLSPDAEAGRRYFYTANNPDISAGGSPVACASCHLDGRTDGHAWGFPGGLSTTPVLVGRSFTETLPWHWSGQFADEESFFVHTITQRMGGTDAAGAAVHDQIVAWLSTAAPTQDNAFKYDAQGNLLPLPASAQRGMALFNLVDSASMVGNTTNPNQGRSCGTCHNPSTSFALTNKAPIPSVLTNQLTTQDVGTLPPVLASGKPGYMIEGQELDDSRAGFDVPSLLNVSRSAPYMHDARYNTLDDRLNDGNIAHGNPTRFSHQDLQDLKAYLLTL